MWAERRVFFRRVRINNEERPVTSSCFACRLSACIIAAVTGRIFVKSDLGDFYETLAMNSTYFDNMTTIWSTLQWDLNTCVLLVAALSIWWSNNSAKGSYSCVLWQHCWFVFLTATSQQYWQNELLRSHSNSGYVNAPQQVVVRALPTSLNVKSGGIYSDHCGCEGWSVCRSCGTWHAVVSWQCQFDTVPVQPRDALCIKFRTYLRTSHRLRTPSGVSGLSFLRSVAIMQLCL